jgi:hypothetical protein
MNKWLLMLLFVPLLFSSCRDDDSQGSSSGGQVTAHFSLSVAGLKSSGGSTRSIDPTTVSESTINNLWVLQFQGATLVSKTYYSAIDPTAFDAKLVSGLSNIYFVANAGSSAFTPFTIGTTTEATFQSTTKSLSLETDVLTNSAYIPMFGSLTSETVPSTGYMVSKTITLTRTLARVTLNYTTGVSNFEIRKIRVCNVPNTMQYYPPTSSTTVFPASPSVSTVNTYDYTDVSGTSGSCTFYLPENQRGTGSNSTTDPTKKGSVNYATYIELVGYTKGATLAGQEVVYKVYLGADSYNDYNICRNTYYSITANISGISAATDARVTRTPRANCYIVAPGKSVYIPLARANDSDLGTQISDLTASGYTFGVVWQDMSPANTNVTFSQSATDQTFGVFKVTAASSYTGNAVVYVKNPSGTILWSWHIWVTSYDPNVTNSTIGTYTFMDRNLGAVNTTPGSAFKGLYYQWGRKDPFPEAGSVAANSFESSYNGSGTAITVPTFVSNTPTTNNLSNSVLYPTNFYYAGTTTSDWYATTVANQNNGLWGTLKTVYDPCPAGWKVMPSAAYSTFSTGTMTYTSSNYGWTHTASSTFWPLSGLLNYNAGTLLTVGSNGYSWSSAPSSASASDLGISTSSVNTSGNAYRAYGMSVRCVQDK